MEKNFKRTTVTSALPYANGPVHIGHLAGVYVPADIYVRYLRLKKEDVLFIGGSDEHGVPITIRAKKEGITPQDVVDRYHFLIKKSFEEFGISFDVYSRTSSKTHHALASDFFRKLYDKGEFIEKIRLDFITTSIAYLGNNRLACYCDYINNPNYSIRSKSPNLILFDLQTRKTQSKLFFNSTINRLGITGLINNLSSTYSNDTVHLIMPLNDTVYSICNNKVQPEYYVDLGVTPQMRELQRTASSSKSAQEASQEDSKPQYPVICNMLESDSVVYLFYRHNNKSYYGFYNPRRKTFKEGVRIWEKNTDNRIPVVNDLDKTIPFMPMATDGKNFYYVMESFYFDYFRNSDNPQIANLSKTITANDNPVIVVAHIKNNP